MRPSTTTVYTIDKLIPWDQHNSTHLIFQSHRLLQKHNISLLDCSLKNAIYSTERIRHYKKISCRFTMPNNKNITFTAHGNTEFPDASARLATFRVVKQIFTHLYNVQWDDIQFEFICKRNEHCCKSNTIKFVHNHKKISFDVIRKRSISHSDGQYVKSGIFCRIGAGIELMNKLCWHLMHVPSSNYQPIRKKNRFSYHNDRNKNVSDHEDTYKSVNLYRSRYKSSHSTTAKTEEYKRSPLREPHENVDTNVLHHVSEVATKLKPENFEQSHNATDRKSVQDWNHYALVYWLNRVNNGVFAHMKYSNLRKHFIIGRIRGNELHKINDIIFKMIGLKDKAEHELILRSLSDLCEKDDYDNIVANTMLCDDIPYAYFDPISYEIMRDPVFSRVSGIIYERGIIEQYINAFHKDPITEKTVYLSDLIPNVQLKEKIDVFIRDNFKFNLV